MADRCCDDIAIHNHGDVTYKNGRPYQWRCKFAWRWPKAIICTAAERPPLLMLNRYPGIVIGICIRLRGTRYLSVLWGRPNGTYEVTRG